MMLQTNRFEPESLPNVDPSKRPIDNNQSKTWFLPGFDDVGSYLSSFEGTENDIDDVEIPGFDPWNPIPAHERYDSNGHESSSESWHWVYSSEDVETSRIRMPTTPTSIQSALRHTVRVAVNHYCSACSTKFSALHILERHAKDSGHKPFRCSEPSCGKSYPRRDTCIRHIATHKQSSHVCAICTTGTVTKAFVRKDHWLQHMRTCHPWDEYLLERKHGCSQVNTSRQEKRQHTTPTCLSEALTNLAVNDESFTRIGEKFDLTRDLNTEQLTEIFATLALVEPQALSPETKKRLEQKARRL